MIRRIISKQSKTITGAAILLGAASFLSRIIGVLRDRIFAHQFGAGETLDIYYAAFRVPDLIYQLIIAGALSAAFIPIFTELWVKGKKDTTHTSEILKQARLPDGQVQDDKVEGKNNIQNIAAWHLTNNMINVFGLVVIVSCLLMFVTMPWLMKLVVPGFDASALTQTVMLARIMLLSPVILGLSGIVSGVLQSKKCFFIYSLTPIFYNIGIILAALFFVPTYGVTALAYGVIVGAIFHLLIQLPTLHHQGFRYTFIFDLKDPNLKRITKMMIPRTLTLGVHQLGLFITTVLASTLSVGSITVFTFANNIQFFPVGIIGISFALAAFPSLSESVTNEDKEAFESQLSNTVRQILFFIIPLSVIFLLLRAQIVRMLLGSGAFDWTATIATSDALAFFTLSLFAQALIPLLVRGFYSFHNTKTPLHIAFVAVLINVIGALALKDSMGVAGLALAFSIASIFQVVVLWIRLKQVTKLHTEFEILRVLYKLVGSAIIMAVFIQLLKQPISLFVDMNTFIGIALQAGILSALGLAIYATLCHFLRVEEMTTILRTLNRRWLKLRNVEDVDFSTEV